MPPTESAESRTEQIAEAVRAHASAIDAAAQGQLRVSWATSGEIRVVLETHFAKEPHRVPKAPS